MNRNYECANYGWDCQDSSCSFNECETCYFTGENKTDCEKQCGKGCYPGSKLNECQGCTYNPENLY